jgi:ribonuclease E
MATKRMLIDASHPEETRVVVVDGTRLEDYDVEVASRRQLKGNIYLAKVTRVEPSLQAAFVDYGGNRHGFLAFNEIHPDYYQIPVADRQALIAEQEAADRAADESAEHGDGDSGELDDDDEIERRRSRPSPRNYKIQEVIKRRQIMLVQVVKEERGTKGAALTTYLSLAGRYCVLMPNTSRGGGISRKIATATDRKRLKKILGELELAEGMAVIVRTAGAGRSKAEIKRDYEYLLRQWTSIRELTLKSMAPTLVYEEGDLIKRSIRDLYGRDIEEIVIQGEPEYRIAKEFMKLFIPSHAKRVRLYEDTDRPLFQSFQVEDQLDAMHLPMVHLRSGSSIVFSPTEALVAIDVNSGRATRERHIEETALRTNLEAADEIARQLRLRDLAGLVVIDFIDMENSRNQGLVERRLKEAMKNDRARVQIGRISSFGLLELSRQRLRPSLLETSFEVCPHCTGTGQRRTTESTALLILRKIEEEGQRHRASEIQVTAAPSVVLYLLNQKRKSLVSIEQRCGLAVMLIGDETIYVPDYRLERIKMAVAKTEEDVPGEPAEADAEKAETVVEVPAAAGAERDDGSKRGRRRRPRRRKRPDEDRLPAQEPLELAADEAEAGEEDRAGDEDADVPVEGEAVDAAADGNRKRRRRGKRGGRRRGRRPTEAEATLDVVAGAETGDEGEPDDFTDEPASAPLDEPVDRMEEAGIGTDDAIEPAPMLSEPAFLSDRPPSEPETTDDLNPATLSEDSAEDEASPRPRRTRRRSPSTRNVEVPVETGGNGDQPTLFETPVMAIESAETAEAPVPEPLPSDEAQPVEIAALSAEPADERPAWSPEAEVIAQPIVNPPDDGAPPFETADGEAADTAQPLQQDLAEPPSQPDAEPAPLAEAEPQPEPEPVAEPAPESQGESLAQALARIARSSSEPLATLEAEATDADESADRPSVGTEYDGLDAAHALPVAEDEVRRSVEEPRRGWWQRLLSQP